MQAKVLATAIAAILASSSGLAQNSSPAAEGERAPRPEREECLRDERRKQENDRAAGGRTTRGTCDALIGPEKELCLKQGGTVEVGAKSGAGATLERAH